MKKIIALALALALLTLTGAALAAGSNGGNKYNTTTTTTTNVEPEKEFIFAFSEDEDLVAWANEEVAKLAESNVADYFGAADAIAKILGEGEYAVNEMLPVYAENYEKSMGDQDITLTFATPYEKDADVAVMLGFKAGDAIEWSAFAGKVQDGSAILVKLDPDTILRVQESNALLAVVNK